MKRAIGLAFGRWIGCTLVVAALAGCGGGDAGGPNAQTGGSDSSNAAVSNTSVPLDAPQAPERDPHRYDGVDMLISERTTRPVAEQQVVLETNLGDITIKLHRDRAPQTVDNFIEYVSSGFYNDTIVHDLEPNVAITLGGYDKQAKKKATSAPIRNEAHKSGQNKKGTVAMVRFEEVDSATSQFMINLADNAQFDHKTRDVPAKGKTDGYGYCVFGEVVAGWDVVEKIAQSKTRNVAGFTAIPTPTVVIKSAYDPKVKAAQAKGVRTARDIRDDYKD